MLVRVRISIWGQNWTKSGVGAVVGLAVDAKGAAEAPRGRGMKPEAPPNVLESI